MLILFIPLCVLTLDLRATPLGQEVLATIQLHLDSGEPISNLIELFESLQEQIQQHKNNITQQHTQHVNECNTKLDGLQIEQLNEQKVSIRLNKIELREQLMTIKPKLTQLEIIASTKEKYKQYLLTSANTLQSGLQRQQQTYDKWATIYDNQRYEFVSYKVPIKADKKSLKPIIYQLTEYINEKITLEETTMDDKKDQYSAQSRDLNDLYKQIKQEQNDLQDQITEVQKQIQQLDIDWKDLLQKLDVFYEFNQQREQIFDDIHQECYVEVQAYKTRVIQLENQEQLMAETIVMLLTDLKSIRSQIQN